MTETSTKSPEPAGDEDTTHGDVIIALLPPELEAGEGEPEVEDDDGVPYDRGWAWMLVLGLFVNFLLLSGYLKSSGIIFVELLHKFNAPTTHTSLLFTIRAGVFSVCGLYVMNVLLVRLGSRKLVVAGGVFMGLSAILSSLARDLTLLIFIHSVLLAVAMSMLISPGEVLLGSYFRQRRSLAVALAKCGASVGNIAVPPLISFLLETYGLSGTLLLYGGIALFAVPAGMLFRPLSFYRKRNSKRRRLQERAMAEEQAQAGAGGLTSGQDDDEEKQKVENGNAVLVDDPGKVEDPSDDAVSGAGPSRLGVALVNTAESGGQELALVGEEDEGVLLARTGRGREGCDSSWVSLSSDRELCEVCLASAHQDQPDAPQRGDDRAVARRPWCRFHRDRHRHHPHYDGTSGRDDACKGRFDAAASSGSAPNERVGCRTGARKVESGVMPLRTRVVTDTHSDSRLQCLKRSAGHALPATGPRSELMTSRQFDTLEGELAAMIRSTPELSPLSQIFYRRRTYSSPPGQDSSSRTGAAETEAHLRHRPPLSSRQRSEESRRRTFSASGGRERSNPGSVIMFLSVSEIDLAATSFITFMSSEPGSAGPRRCAQSSLRSFLSHTDGEACAQHQPELLSVLHDDGDDDDEGEQEEAGEKTSSLPCWKVLRCVLSCPRRIVSVLDFSLFRSSLFLLLLVYCSIAPLVNVSLDYLPALAAEQGVSERQAALLVSVVGVLDLVCRLSCGFLADRALVSVQRMIMVTFTVLALLVQFVSFFTSFTQLLALAVLQGLLGGVSNCLMPVLIIDFVGLENMGKAIGFCQLVSGASMAVTFPILGYIKDSTGHYASMYHVIGCGMLVAVGVLALEGVVRRREEASKAQRRPRGGPEHNNSADPLTGTGQQPRTTDHTEAQRDSVARV